MNTFYWPDYAGVRKAKMYIRALSRGYESALNRQASYGRLAGERWEAEFELAPMAQGTAITAGIQLRAWLSAIDGMAGAIVVRDPTYRGPYGGISAYLYDQTAEPPLNPALLFAFSDATAWDDGTEWADQPAVVQTGASAVPLDESIQLAGLPASVTAAFVTGDLIQVGHEFSGCTQLLQVTTGGSADANGAVRLGVRPRIRNSFPAGTPVYLLNPACLMRLAGDDQAGVVFDPDQATHAVKLLEAI